MTRVAAIIAGRSATAPRGVAPGATIVQASIDMPALRRPGDRGPGGRGDRVRRHGRGRGRRQPEPVRAAPRELRADLRRLPRGHLRRLHGGRGRQRRLRHLPRRQGHLAGRRPGTCSRWAARRTRARRTGPTTSCGRRTGPTRCAPATHGASPATRTGASSRRSPRSHATSRSRATRRRAAPATRRRWSAARRRRSFGGTPCSPPSRRSCERCSSPPPGSTAPGRRAAPSARTAKARARCRSTGHTRS